MVPRGDCLDEQGKSAEALRCTQQCLSISLSPMGWVGDVVLPGFSMRPKRPSTSVI